jgi:hypothetical protein
LGKTSSKVVDPDIVFYRLDLQSQSDLGLDRGEQLCLGDIHQLGNGPNVLSAYDGDALLLDGEWRARL